MNTKPRILWDKSLKARIAAATLEKLGGHDYSKQDLWRAFQEVVSDVVPKEQRRTLMGLSQIPWLEQLLRGPNISLPSAVNDGDIPLIFDTLTELERKIETLTGLNQQMDIRIRELRHIILKRRKRARERRQAASPPTNGTPNKLRVVVAGVEAGRFRDQIRRRIEGFPGLDVRFADIFKGVADVPTDFDHLIMTRFTPGLWMKTARKRYGDKAVVVSNNSEAIDLIHRLVSR